MVTCAATVSVANGPAAAVTPGTCAAPASCAADASVVSTADRDVGAVLRRERVVERAVRVGEHAEGENRGGGGGEHDQADDDGLQPAAAEAAAGGAEDGAHGRAPLTVSEATRPSAMRDDPPGVAVRRAPGCA